MPKTRAKVAAKVENVVILALSGHCTVRYSGGRMRQVVIALDGVRPPLTLTLAAPENGDTPVNVASGNARVDGLTRATDLIHEIGHYIATSTGVESGAPERITR